MLIAYLRSSTSLKASSVLTANHYLENVLQDYANLCQQCTLERLREGRSGSGWPCRSRTIG